MNTPLERTLQIIDKNGTVIWQADLIEVVDETDPEAAKYFDSVPIFHGLSRGGDVTGKLVDGNYCTKDDFDGLAAAKTDLKGSIVLCRYGGIFRGLKVKGGQESGAAVPVYSSRHATTTCSNFLLRLLNQDSKTHLSLIEIGPTVVETLISGISSSPVKE